MNWMTVNDVAKYLKLSTMMIYKLAQKGHLPAAKIGRVWRFEKESIDQWLKSQQRPTDYPDLVSQILADFIIKLREVFKDKLLRIVLFGSYARGDWVEGSDIDVLVVLKTFDGHSQAEEQVEKISYDVTYNMDRAILLAPILMDEKEFLTGLSPLLLNVRKEGKIAA